MIGPWSDTTLPVFLSDPVFRHHPLNRGRLAWWMNLLGLDGGRFFYDLISLYPGTLTNMTTAASGWRGTTRPGGFGHLLFDGVDGHSVTLNSNVGLGASNATIACWAYLSGTSLNGAFIKVGDTSTGYGIGVGSGTMESVGNTLIAIYEGVRWVNSAVTIGTGWHHVALAIDGSGRPTFSLDGRAVYSDAGSAPIAPSANLGIGGYNPGRTRWFTGPIDDVTAYSRTLTATEVQALYNSSRLGYPGVLNRLNPAMMPGAAAIILPWCVGDGDGPTYGWLAG